MKVVENAKDWWRWYSVHAMTVAAAVQGAWLALPDDMRASAPDGLVHLVTLALMVLGVSGRMVKQ